MEEHYFLLIIAGAWLVFASVQDLKKTEVANWVSYSLIGIALAYKGIYAGYTGELKYLIYGGIGFALFAGLAHAFYYTKTFGGADAKLLMGMGAVIPFESWKSLAFLSIEFIFLLFFLGTIYSLIYSLVLAVRNRDKLLKEMRKKYSEYKGLIALSAAVASVVFILLRDSAGGILSAGLVFASALFIYLKAFEKSCLIVKRKPGELIEGDWLEKEIRIGGKTIRKSVHGLSREDIRLLKKYRRNAVIKQGIPFVPAFLIAFMVMVFSSAFLQSLLERMFSLFLLA